MKLSGLSIATLALWACTSFWSVKASAAFWPFKPKPSNVIKIKLQDYIGSYSERFQSDASEMTLVYEFGPEEDRVWIESPQTPKLHEKELFRGQIQAMALTETDFAKQLARITPEVRARVNFFAAELERRSYTSRHTRGKTVSLITQSYFMTDQHTIVFDYGFQRGLTAFALDKVYEDPPEIKVHYAEDHYAENIALNGHPRYRPLHFAVSVKSDQPNRIIYNRKLAPQNSIQLAYLTRMKRAQELYYSFIKHLFAHFRSDLVKSVESLLPDLRETALTPKHIEALEQIDRFFFNTIFDHSGMKFTVPENKSAMVSDSLLIRLNAFGSQYSPHETWFFQYEPLLAETDDFLPYYEPDQWDDYEPGGDKAAALVRVTRGFIGTQFYLGQSYFHQIDSNKLLFTFNYPTVGLADTSGAKIELPASIKFFDKKIKEQQAKNLIGNGATSQKPFEDWLERRAEDPNCGDLLP